MSDGTDGGRVLSAIVIVVAPSNPLDPSDLSDPSAGEFIASVVAVAAGLRCPSDATVPSSERSFINLSL